MDLEESEVGDSNSLGKPSLSNVLTGLNVGFEARGGGRTGGKMWGVCLSRRNVGALSLTPLGPR